MLLLSLFGVVVDCSVIDVVIVVLCDDVVVSCIVVDVV